MTDTARAARRRQAKAALRQQPPIPETDGTDRARVFFDVLNHRLPCRPALTVRTAHPKAS